MAGSGAERPLPEGGIIPPLLARASTSTMSLWTRIKSRHPFDPREHPADIASVTLQQIGIRVCARTTLHPRQPGSGFAGLIRKNHGKESTEAACSAAVAATAACISYDWSSAVASWRRESGRQRSSAGLRGWLRTGSLGLRSSGELRYGTPPPPAFRHSFEPLAKHQQSPGGTPSLLRAMTPPRR